MKHVMTLLLFISSISAWAAPADSTITYALPDSVRATGFIATLELQEVKGSASIGIRNSEVTLAMGVRKKKHYVELLTPVTSTIIAMGLQVTKEQDGALVWKTDWQENERFKLYLASAADSAGGFTLYSGYIFFPSLNKWKLIGTCRVAQWQPAMQQLQSFRSSGKKRYVRADLANVWCQRSNGTWRNLQPGDGMLPVLAPFSSIDSVQQFAIDISVIDASIQLGSTDARTNVNGVYHAIMKEGTGQNVTVTDTLTVFYKGYLFADGSVFDETKEKPATFPLGRLIKGWQVGLVQCKVGGKIKLVIPSGLAYSIRTRAPKIPPNSILVFEIEVVEAKPAVKR
jgi:hypothetical protein